jgi:charged multivesicular body protein 2A
MKSMAKSMNLPRLNKIMMEYTQESEKMEMQQEMLGDTIDDVMDADQDEEEEDKIVSQVLDEIGIDMSGALLEAPTANVAIASATAPKSASAVAPPPVPVATVVSDSAVSELEARLNNLRRS